MNDSQQWNEQYDLGRDYSGFNEILLARICELTKKNGASLESALDIGCGTGDLVDSLSKCLPGAQVEGIDFSESAVRIAQEKYPDLKFSVGNAENDLLKKEWGIITCNLMIAFVKDKERFLTQVKDHLAIDGVFVLNSPVLLDDGEYRLKDKNISVDFRETDALLKRIFPACILYDESFISRYSSRDTWLLAHNPAILGLKGK